MKRIYYILLAMLPVFFACEEKETEDISRETPVPHMELLGDNPVVVIKGAEFNDPGIYGESYTPDGDTIKNLEYSKLSALDTDVPGTYKITYEVENSEGVPFYINRTVNVVDFTGYDVFELPTGSYSGYWTGTDGRLLGTGIQIQKITTGIYSISDLIGGLYAQYAGYGPSMAGPGILVINENGDLRSELGHSDGFGADISTSNMTYDAATNTISYTFTIEGGYGWSYDISLRLE